MGEGYRVELEVYSGPLDLLLQLVRRAEVNLYDIPVARITDQYLTYLRSLPELDVETAADFLVLAATLLALKARLLLPAPAAPPGDEEEGAEEDPRAELVRRLLVYRQFKEAAGLLARRLAATNRSFDPGVRPAWEPAQWVPEPGCLAGQLRALVLAYRAALAAAAQSPPEHQVGPLPVTVGEKMAFIAEVLRVRGCVSFEELFPGGRRRSVVVATFLALLELVRQGMVRVRQEEPLGRLEVIQVASRPQEGGAP
ncbi:MAG TPA: segregation/condensation protein A [Firmicutes bacterium]|nr:segregation/condensation protein A [Bacillota bacterium]